MRTGDIVIYFATAVIVAVLALRLVLLILQPLAVTGLALNVKYWPLTDCCRTAAAIPVWL